MLATMPNLSDGTIALRPLCPSDAAALYESVVESIAHLSPWVPWCHAGYARAETDSFIAFAEKAWSERGEYPFGIFSAADGRHLGGIGINHIVKPYQLGNVGYWVRSSGVGRGIAGAAVRLVSRYAFETLGLTRIEIACVTENRASRRVAEKVGARFEALCRNRLVVRGKPVEAALYSLIPGDVPIDCVKPGEGRPA